MIDGLQDIDLAEIARSKGIELRKSGNCYVGLCPLHHEKTPSFFIFPDNKFKCWGCGQHGDAIDLVQKVHGISFPDALTHLGLNQRPLTPDVRRQIQERKQGADLVRRFRRWEVRKADQIATMIRCINKITTTWKTPDDLERDGDILNLLPHYEYQLDILCSRDDRKKFQLLTGQEIIEPFDLGQSIRVWINRNLKGEGITINGYKRKIIKKKCN